MPQPEDQVYAYVRGHPGNFKTSEVRLGTGLGGSTVSSILKRMLGEDPRLTKMTRGKWHYDAKAPAEAVMEIGTLMECTGYDEDGHPVVQDEKGRTFVARPTGLTIVVRRTI